MSHYLFIVFTKQLFLSKAIRLTYICIMILYYEAAKLRYEVLCKHRQATAAAAYSRGIYQFTLYHAHHWAGLDHVFGSLFIYAGICEYMECVLSLRQLHPVNTIKCIKLKTVPCYIIPSINILSTSKRFRGYHVHD